MKRRTALLNIATAAASTLNLPAWATGWSAASLAHVPSLLPDEQEALLAEVAETFIPATDTPGAKALSVHQFVQRMVADCYDAPSQELFRKGLAACDQQARQVLGTSFQAGNAEQRADVLFRMMQSDEPVQKTFCQMMKRLTIQGYMTSEYVMTNLTHYEMAPGYYRGCVSLPKQNVPATH